jgi:hypothetical protein
MRTASRLLLLQPDTGRAICQRSVSGGLRDTIKDMDGVVHAFEASNGMPEAQRLLMLSMTASVARELMLQAADDFRTILTLSPQLRAAIASENRRHAPKGGAA